jgi:steroid delta-isomerase-like uncharacterized protein
MAKLNFSLTCLVILLLFSICIYNGCQVQEERTYTDAQFQSFMDNSRQLWTGGNLDLVDSLYAEAAVRHNADLGDEKGPEEIKKFVQWVYTAYPDFKVTFDESFKLKDRIVIHWTATGTNDGPLSENMPPTEVKVSFSGISMSTIDNGKITEEWSYYNQLPIYNQMGYELVLKGSEEEKKD